jgi:hypothetical protein
MWTNIMPVSESKRRDAEAALRFSMMYEDGSVHVAASVEDRLIDGARWDLLQAERNLRNHSFSSLAERNEYALAVERLRAAIRKLTEPDPIC